MKLNELQINQSADIVSVGGTGATRQHFLDMGIIPGMDVTVVKFAPMGDPVQILISGYELTIRLEDAEKIEIENVHVKQQKESSARTSNFSKVHPRLGETWETSDYYKEHANKKKHEGKLVFALAGNQNCGKTTLFNQLTGSNQHVGNFPGVTVDRKSGSIIGHPETEIVDLPGIYSLSPYTSEEIVSRQFILDENPTAIINIVDATNIERNLYLTLQLLELGKPMVIALNMMDEMSGNGGSVDINRMEDILQVPVVPVSAAKNQGISELVEHALHIATYEEAPGRNDFCDKNDHGGAVHRAIHGIISLIEDHAERAGIPARFAASKLIEGDHLIEEKLQLEDNEKVMITNIKKQMEEERGLDCSAAIADMRYTFIRHLSEETVIKPHSSKEQIRSEKIDSFLTGKWTAIPMFVVIMGLVFYLSFNVIGLFFQNLLDEGITLLSDYTDTLLTTMNVAAPIHSLVIDAIFKGVGTVVSFVPIIVTLYFFLSMLEDSGYMARIAFIMDRLLRKIGLSGRSIVPMLIGFGCTVPAVMSTRTLPSERDRRITRLLIPFMSCSAKMPIYAFFANAFFKEKAGLVMILMYFIGIIISILVAFIANHTFFKGDAVPFVMELPNYRLPSLKSVTQLMWDKAKDFLQRAFTVIFLGTIIVWFLQNFNFTMHMVTHSDESMLAAIGGLITPLFRPLGFNSWKLNTALISGFMAKESVVSMLTVLYGSTAALRSSLTALDAFTYLVFCLLYTPCIAAVSAYAREAGKKEAFSMIAFQIGIAWIVSFIVHSIGLLL